MTVVRGLELGRELAKVIAEVNKCIEEEKARAKRIDASPYALRDADGSLVLAPLLSAKANALHAIVLINQRG